MNAKMITRRDIKISRRRIGFTHTGPWKREVRRAARRRSRQEVAAGNFDYLPRHLTGWDID